MSVMVLLTIINLLLFFSHFATNYNDAIDFVFRLIQSVINYKTLKNKMFRFFCVLLIS